jgi:hypothetical protein
VTEAPVSRNSKKRASRQQQTDLEKRLNLQRPSLKKTAIFPSPKKFTAMTPLAVTPSKGMPIRDSHLVHLTSSSSESASAIKKGSPQLGLPEEKTAIPRADSENSPALHQPKNSGGALSDLSKPSIKEPSVPPPTCRIDPKEAIRAKYHHLKFEVYPPKKEAYETMTKDMVSLRDKIIATKDVPLQALFLEQEKVHRRKYDELSQLHNEIILLKSQLS